MTLNAQVREMMTVMIVAYVDLALRQQAQHQRNPVCLN